MPVSFWQIARLRPRSDCAAIWDVDVTALRAPNERLRGLLAEARWSGQQLANAVNLLGAEEGLRLHYDRTSVAHWLTGICPRPPVPELIVEALTRRLSQPVAVSALFATAGVDSESAGTGLQQVEVSKWLAELSTARGSASHGVYSVAALALPAWHPAIPVRGQGRAQELGQVTAQDVAAAVAMTQLFSEADAAFGSGQVRKALSGYLAVDIAPKLKARATPSVHRALLAAATDLTYLCGFMCFDQQAHGAAQRYYLAALRLATENNDAAKYAITLRALSVQARALGHDQDAAALARTALSSAPANTSPGTLAFLHGQAAVTAARSGDRQAALAHLSTAERNLDRASTGSTIGAYHQASLAHQHAAVLAALGDRGAAAGALASSIRQRPVAERRSRALNTASLAELHLGQGHLDLATATWQGFLDDYPHLQCGRADTALTTMRARLRPHQRNTAAKAVLQRAALI
jgi:tetratricopeptide (TPR) repeat protein